MAQYSGARSDSIVRSTAAEIVAGVVATVAVVYLFEAQDYHIVLS